MISYQKLVFLTFPNMLIICNVVVRRLKVCAMDVQNRFERQVKILFFDSFGVVVDLRRVVLETCADSGQRAFPISLRRIRSSMQWVTEISSAIFLQRCRNFLWVSLGQGENINNCKQPFVENKGFYAVLYSVLRNFVVCFDDTTCGQASAHSNTEGRAQPGPNKTTSRYSPRSLAAFHQVWSPTQ